MKKWRFGRPKTKQKYFKGPSIYDATQKGGGQGNFSFGGWSPLPPLRTLIYVIDVTVFCQYVLDMKIVNVEEFIN